MLTRRILLKRTILATAAASIGATGFVRRASAKTTRVALIMTGSITDGSWNQPAYEGLVSLKGAGAFETAYVENVTQAKIPQVVQGYADDGYDLIIGHGFEFGSAFMELAPQYTRQKFFATTFKPAGKIPDNLGFVDLAFYGAGYGAGALAALISKSKKAVGFVGGGDNPTQQRVMRCFKAGAEKTVPGIKGMGIVTGDYDNVARGKEAAETMVANSADVIFHAAGVTGLGAIQGAVSGGAIAIGSFSDQTALAPGKMATSFVVNLNLMVTTVAKSVPGGSFVAGDEWTPSVTEMWSLRAGDKGDHDPALVSQEAWSKFLSIWQDLGSKKINVAQLVP